MDSAMRRLRFSRWRPRRRVCGSEWTAARCSWLPAVALLLGARQRRLGLGLKGAGKVGVGLRVRSVTVRLSPGSGPTEALQGMPLVARVPSFRPAVECGGLLAVLGDAAGRWGGDLVPCP